MKKLIASLLAAVLLGSLFCGCSVSGQLQTDPGAQSSQDTDESPVSSEAQSEKKQISLWFWAAPLEHQVIMRQALEDAINSRQDEYELTITFQAGNDTLISTALAADSGPDIVFTSGPSYVTNFASAGKLANLDAYSEQYGWKERSIDSLYDLTTYDGSLYAIGNSIAIMGVFYNKKVIADLGYEIPTTVEEMEEIMDAAIDAGLYGGVTGNKQWKPINSNYVSLFLNHFAGADAVYDCLTGEQKWNNPEMVNAFNKSAEWYQKGYLGGDNYYDLNFDESVQMLALGRAPFFVGPSNVFQWAINYFTGVTADDFGFMPFPAVGDNDSQYPMYVLGEIGCLSINAASPYQDECAEILDFIYSNEFFTAINDIWPGYWAVPIKDLDIPEDSAGVAGVWNDTLRDVYASIEAGKYGYYSLSFFPAATEVASQDIDCIWQGTMTAEEVLSNMDAEFEKELADGRVVPLEPRP